MNQKYIFFGGKGGVGKTTCACASALQYAENYKTLIISTDPAHSISDSFGVNIGSEPTFITKNLYGIEVNPEDAKAKNKKALMAEKEGLPDIPDMGFGMDFGEISEIMNMEFPGMDEVSALTEFMKYSEYGDYNFEKIIIDTAPTGHTLRLLSLPEIMNSWIGKMIKMRMKFENIMGMFKHLLGGGEKDNSLKASPKTAFVLVMIPEQMSISESIRYVKALINYKMDVPKIIVNKVTPENQCEFCTARREYQAKNLDEIHKLFNNKEIVEIPLFSREIKDMDNLEFFRRFMFL